MQVLILIGKNGGDPMFAHHSGAPAARAEGGTCAAP
jgi:hypothetical protein